MIFIKWTILFAIFFISTVIGISIADRYKNRVNDLKNIRNILNILETKIKFTYEPLPQIFEEISNEFTGEVSRIFQTAKEKMLELSAGEAWHFAIENSNTNMNEEDLNILKGLEKLLGKTDIDGQLSEINLIKEFIDVQIKKAEEEQIKNAKLYKNLGIMIGMIIVIILI